MQNFIGRNFRVSEKMRYFLLVFFISLVVFKVLMQIHEEHFDSLVDANYGIVTGWPHWFVFQNRLMGPYAVYAISKTGLSYLNSLRIFMLLMTVIQNVLLFFLLVTRGISYPRALSAIVLFSFMFIGIQHYWIASWDQIDLVIFTLVAFGIFHGARTSYYLVLFVVALLNRESALFISAFLMIDAFRYDKIPGKGLALGKVRLVSVRKLAAGALLICLGVAYTKAVRDALFNFKKLGHQGMANPIMGSSAALGNHIPFTTNLKNLFYANLGSINILNTVFFIGSMVYLSYYLRAYSEQQAKAYLLYLLIAANLLVFGTVNETRVYFILLPFLVFFHAEIGRPRESGSAEEPCGQQAG